MMNGLMRRIILTMIFFSIWMLMLFDFEDASASSRTCQFICVAVNQPVFHIGWRVLLVSDLVITKMFEGLDSEPMKLDFR